MSIAERIRRFVEPSASILDVAERRRARVLTSLILALVPLGWAAIISQLIIERGFLPTFISNAVTLVLLMALGLLGRTRFYRLAAGASTLVVIGACAMADILRPSDPVWWAYEMLAVLLATLLVSLRGAALVALLALGSVLVVGAWHGLTSAQLLPPLMFHLVFAPLLLLTAYHRDRLEDDRRAELLAQQRLIEEAERVAHIGHFRVTAGGASIEVSATLRELLAFGDAPVSLGDFLARLEPGQPVEALLSGTGNGTVDCSVDVPGGAARHVSLSVETVTQDGDRVVLGTLQDITARVHAEEEKAALRERAYEGQRLETVGRIAGGVAHDFNNLLTVISSSSALARDCSPVERELHLDEIDAASQRGALLVRQLLAYARKQVLEPDRIELTTIVAELTPILERLAGKGVLRVRAEGEEPLPVRADRSQLEQVLVNLVVNARDAIGPGGAVEVRTGMVSNGPAATPLEDVRCAYLVVADDGSGMPAETRGRIFEPFFTTKGDRGGTGLGLSTVHGIVLQSGGQIEVESAPGEGTTCRIYLPLVAGDPGPAPARPSGEPPGDRRKVLVIDDQEPVLRSTTRMLQHAGHDVIAACGAAEARERWREHKAEIGVLLSDVVMPGTDGLTLVRELTKDAPGVRVVLMSGFSAETVARHDLAEFPLLQKPFSYEALIEAVRGRPRS